MHDRAAFLSWRTGSLLEPSNRQACAEWLVYRSLGLDPGPFRSGGPVPLGTGAFSLAVRSAAAVPTGRPQQPAAISFPLDEPTAIAFVFCLLSAPIAEEVDPLDPRQWLFWLVPVSRLHPDRHSLGLQPLIRAHGHGVACSELPSLVEALRRAAS